MSNPKNSDEGWSVLPAPAMAAFAGEVGPISTVPTRGVVKITIEAPIEEFPKIASILKQGSWVAVAVLEHAPEQSVKANIAGGRRPFDQLPLAQQAGIRCNEAAFQRYTKTSSVEQAAEYVRAYCMIESRREFETNGAARDRWFQLNNAFLAWMDSDKHGIG